MRILGLTNKGLKIKTKKGHIIYYNNLEELSNNKLVDKLIKYGDNYDKLRESKNYK